MRAFLLALAMMATVLSGCAGEPAGDETPDDTTPEPGETTTDDGNSTPAPEAPEDSNVTGATGYVAVELTADQRTIEPGQSVVFNITAAAFFDNGTQAEAPVAWTLSFSNATLGEVANGTGSLSLNHTFADVGGYILVLNGSADGFGFATANVTILVEEYVLMPPGPGEGTETDYSCSMTAGTPFITLTGNVNLGACTLMTTNQLSVLVSKTTPGGCSVNGNVDQAYDAGKKFTASCTGGEVQPTVTIKVRTWT